MSGRSGFRTVTDSGEARFMEEPQVYLNGRFVPASSAAISLADSGFVLGAAVAEQVRTFAGKLFRLDDHLARLEQSLDIVGVDPGVGQ
jgi:branched-subunit amino acid aminotransferase/4-amino-4-deoxychorismate lyase